MSDPEKDATQLLEQVWGSRGVPVDPIAIAHELGLQVLVGYLDEGWDGALVKRVGEEAKIYLNRANSRTRQRFSCAHELGHYYKRVAEGEDDFEFVDKRNERSSAGTDADEIYANGFAAALLMPYDSVVQCHEQRMHPATMAHAFGVSVQAMSYRLQNLRLPA